jgi:circadian clock protein KaiC
VSEIQQDVIRDINQMMISTKLGLKNERHDCHIIDGPDNSFETNINDNSATGIKEFDRILEGGFPKGSVVLLAGSSGSGKTIFSFQWLFEGIKQNENCIYITLTEPLFKILKNLENMNFYDRNAIEKQSLSILDLREVFKEKHFKEEEILSFIEQQVKQCQAKRLCIDSITAIAYNLDNKQRIRSFIFELGKILATMGCTTVLISEVHEQNKYSIYEVEEFISDAILRLDQIKRNSKNQRFMKVVKVRGRKYDSDDIPISITKDGLHVFPNVHNGLNYESTEEKIATGNMLLDEMLYGGIVKYSSTLIAGTTGAGKSILSLQFILDGLQKKEKCLLIGFEESKNQLLRNAKVFGWDLGKYEQEGLLSFYCSHPTDAILEQHYQEIYERIVNKDIKRCVIDSLSAVSHAYSLEDSSIFISQVNGLLKKNKVTSFFTAATGDVIGSSSISDNNISSVVDNIIMLRYVEMAGKLESVINVLKMRGSGHHRDLRRYIIDNAGIQIKESLSNYEGIMTGVSKRIHQLEAEGERLKQLLAEKEAMQHELKTSEEKYRTIFENSAVGIMLTDEKENIISWNKFTENLLGMGEKDLLLRPVKSLYPLEEWKKLREENVRQKGMKCHYKTKMYKKDNILIDVNLSLSVLKDDAGKIIGSIGILEDITEQLKLENKLNEAISLLKVTQMEIMNK